MNRLVALVIAVGVPCFPASGGPEERGIDLREAIRLAKEQNPELQIARLQVEKSASDLRLARSDRAPHVHAASGLGATYGIPQSVQGAAPSVAQFTVRQPLVDFERSRRTEGVAALVESSQHAARASRNRAVYRAGVVYLDFELAAREIERLRQERASFERIEELVAARVDEGLEVALALARAGLDTARATDRLDTAAERYALLEDDLRWTLGLVDRVRLRPLPAAADGDLGVPASLAAVPESVVGEHPDIAGIAAQLRAARSKAREERSGRYPSLDIVGQYALLARFNNYDDYFRRFERHNWQAGIALRVPLFTGRGVAERVAKARIEERELALRQNAKRAAVGIEGRQAAARLREAERSKALASKELAYARQNLDVLMAQFDEGQVSLAEIERARILESTAWGGLIASRYAVAKARLGVAHSVGSVAAAFGD